MRYSFKVFNNFVKSINLESYRSKYSRIKTVEMDLPKNIQALNTIYANYWDNEHKFNMPPTFEEYYKIYTEECGANINKFWAESGFGKECDCFPRGLEARIYRPGHHF